MDFAKIFEHITSPLSIAEPEYPNKLIYVNKAYCDLTGYSSDELLGINPGKLLQKETPSAQREWMRKKFDAHEPLDVLVKNFRKDGTWYWNGLHIHPVIEDGKCIYWVGMAKDVTDFVESVNTGLEAVISVVKDNFRQMKEALGKV